MVEGGAYQYSFLGNGTYFTSSDFDPEQEKEKDKRGKEGERERKNNSDIGRKQEPVRVR